MQQISPNILKRSWNFQRISFSVSIFLRSFSSTDIDHTHNIDVLHKCIDREIVSNRNFGTRWLENGIKNGKSFFHVFCQSMNRPNCNLHIYILYDLSTVWQWYFFFIAFSWLFFRLPNSVNFISNLIHFGIDIKFPSCDVLFFFSISLSIFIFRQIPQQTCFSSVLCFSFDFFALYI